MKSEKGNVLLKFFVIILISSLIILFTIIILNLRLDYAKGQHKITPTAIDNDFWGNYKVYFKTSEYTQNNNEDFYYIEKGNEELKKQMEECIKNEKTVIVYYDKWVGFKDIGAPETAPIIKIEVLEEGE